MNVAGIITAVENLIEFLIQLKANGSLTDEQLDAAVASTNQQTRDLIKQALASGKVPPITQ